MVQSSTPRQRIGAAAEREGESAFVRRCLDLLTGRVVEADLIEILGGDSAPAVLVGRAGGVHGYWVRTWALRAFLYAWDPEAEAEVVASCQDEHWRVREMAAKVLAKRGVTSESGEKALEKLATDEHERVRRAARRALGEQ